MLLIYQLPFISLLPGILGIGDTRQADITRTGKRQQIEVQGHGVGNVGHLKHWPMVWFCRILLQIPLYYCW